MNAERQELHDLRVAVQCLIIEVREAGERDRVNVHEVRHWHDRALVAEQWLKTFGSVDEAKL